MLHRLNIAKRLIILILGGGGCLLLVLTYFDHQSIHEALSREIRARCSTQAETLSSQIANVLENAQTVAEQLSLSAADANSSRGELENLVLRSLETHDSLSGVGIYLNEKDGEPYLPLAHRQGQQIAVQDLNDVDIYARGAYREYDWFALAAETGSAWTDPYFGPAEDAPMVSYGVSIERGDDFLGVAGTDLHLDALKGICESLNVIEGGYVFLVSGKGVFIVHPNPNYVLQESLFSLADKLKRPDLRDLGHEMVSERSGVIDWLDLQDEAPHWLAYTPVPESNWSIGVVYPQGYLRSQIYAMATTQLFYGGIALIVLALLAWVIAWAISSPIRRFETAVRHVAEGNLDAPVPHIQGSDEIAQLARSFTTMTAELKKHVQALQEAAEERGRVESDLRAARAIQMGLLPKTFDVGTETLEIYALMEPAREVGGDLYDFGFLDKRRFFVVIGDVSGKGFPAALFMSLARTYLRFHLSHADVGTALSHANRALAQENDAMMFVTIFCAVIDLESGECSFANAGHMPPCLLRGSTVETFPNNAGFLVGPDPATQYQTSTIQLSAGDGVLLYTDGIIEAEGPDGFYGQKRMEALLAQEVPASCKNLVTALRADVKRFSGEMAQSDDITVLMFRYDPSRASGDTA